MNQISMDYLQRKFGEKLGRDRMLQRLRGMNTRAQVLVLNYEITKETTSTDTYTKYHLPASQKVVLPDLPLNESHEFVSPKSEGVQMSATYSSLLPNRERGVCTVGESCLDTLREDKQYDTVVGVHFEDGQLENFERTMRGLAMSQADKYRNETKSTLAIVFVDGVDILLRPGNQPLQDQLSHIYKLFDLSIVQQFLETVDHIDYDSDSKTYDLVLAFESTLVDSMGSLHAEHTTVTDPPYIDVLLVVKPHSKGLLHTHLWLMAGFGINLNPRYIVSMDIDVEPRPESLQALTKGLYFPGNIDNSEDEKGFLTEPGKGTVAAACGELEVRHQAFSSILSGSQWFEYKMSYIMSKRVENLYGHVSALSPAFSMYSWFVLKQVLSEYFQPFVNPEGLCWSLSNLYRVAPERVLSHHLFKQIGASGHYKVRFNKRAKAEISSIVTFQQFFKSKWQLVSGQWFFALCTISGALEWPKKMGCWQSTKYFIFRLYFYLAILFSWFSVAGLYIALSICARRTLDGQTTASSSSSTTSSYSNPSEVLQTIYILVFLISLLISISRSAERLMTYWLVVCLLYGLLSLFFVAAGVALIYQNIHNPSIQMCLGISALGMLMFSPAVLSWSPIKSVLFSFCYMFLVPSYINILTAISITKTDDFIWLQAVANSYKNRQVEFSLNKMGFINAFVIVNVALGGFLDWVDKKGDFDMSYVLLSASVGMLGIPLVLLLFAKALKLICGSFTCLCAWFNKRILSRPLENNINS